MTDPTLTHLVLILDRSGSMGDDGKAAEAEKGVRALLDEQIAVPGRLEVTIARFDTEYELLALAQIARDVLPDSLRIVPRGMTALFDAVGQTVTTVGSHLASRPDHLRPGRVIVLVATDGLENASRRYNSTSLRQLVEQQTNKYGWEFMFMGTSQEAVLQALAVGFNADTTYSSSDTAMGVSSAYAGASSSILRGRVKGTKITVTDEDRATLK